MSMELIGLLLKFIFCFSFQLVAAEKLFAVLAYMNYDNQKVQIGYCSNISIVFFLSSCILS